MVGNDRNIAVFVFLACGAVVGAAVLTGSAPSLLTDPVQKALDCLQKGDYLQAEKQGLSLATDAENASPRAWAIVAAARQRRGDLAQAARAYRLLLGASESPDLQQFALAQVQVCEQPAAKPQAPVPPSKKLAKDDAAALAVVADKEFAESTEHFVVRARNQQLAKLLAVEAEVALDRICRVILAGQEYSHSVTINVWPDHQAYRAHAADAPEWSGGSFRLVTADGVTTRQIDLTQRDARGQFAMVMLDRVLPHEMCHLVMQEFFGDATCPLFLNEGLAMIAESDVDHSRTRITGKTIAGRAKLSLEALLVSQRYNVEEPTLFYSQSFSFMEFLHQRTTGEQFRSFLEHIRSGCTTADALQRSLYLPANDAFLPALASAWEDHAVEQAQFEEALAAKDRAEGRE
jgi:hypothetical protein